MDWRGSIDTLIGLYNYSALFNDPSGPISGISVKRFQRGFEAAAKLNVTYLPAVDTKKYQMYDNLIGHGQEKVMAERFRRPLRSWFHKEMLSAVVAGDH